MTEEVTAEPALISLRYAWELRNAATSTMVRTEDQFRRLVETAGPQQLIALLEAFSPARSAGPDWTRSFEPLIERLSLWCAPETLAAAEAEFRGRGAPWIAVANSLTPEHAASLRSRLVRNSAGSRLPALTIA